MTHYLVAGDRLKDRLERSAEAAGCRLTWMAERSGAYDAVMFTGGAHRLTVGVIGLSARQWVEQLDEYSVRLPGYVLMQLEVGCVEHKGEQLLVELEAITVKEA